MDYNECADYEPFDRTGLTEWTNVFDCDEDDCENRVAVYDPYGTCALVLCAEHNGGFAEAGPIEFPPEPDEEDDRYADWDAEFDAYVEAAYQRYLRSQKLGKLILGFWIGVGIALQLRRRK